MVQKGNFDCGVDEEKDKRLFRNQERHSKGRGDRFNVLACGKSEGLEGNIVIHFLQVQVFGNVNATYKQRKNLEG